MFLNRRRNVYPRNINLVHYAYLLQSVDRHQQIKHGWNKNKGSVVHIKNYNGAIFLTQILVELAL
jgi:hypothetical protein